MKRNCPTIQELLAFDAVTRHQCLTRAASALCISVSGVSKQLTGLEQFIGKALFQKVGRGVQLTGAVVSTFRCGAKVVPVNPRPRSTGRPKATRATPRS